MSTAINQKKVWTLKIRLLHWFMALFIVLNLFIFDEGDDIHYWIGYGTLAIVFFRTIIGFTSQGFDSFRKFTLQPRELFYFFRNLFSHARKDYTGHNPAASYAYIIFWLLVIGLGITGGLLVHSDYFFGNQLLEELHDLMADATIVFIVIHLTGVLLDSFLHRRKSWMSIIK